MNVISFASGSLGRVPVLERVLQQSLAEVDPAMLLAYAEPTGLPELRRGIAGLYGHGLTEESVTITSSAQQALGIIFDALAQEGKDTFFVQEPAYFGAIRILKKYECPQVIPFEDLEAIDYKIRTAAAGVVYLTSNFHNPTGETLSQEWKRELATTAKENGFVLIEDNPHDFLYFGEERPTNIFELAPKNAIYISGFSKILGPGLRIGYVIADKETIAKLKSGKISQDIFTSTIGQQVCLSSLRQSEYLDELRAYFRCKRNFALHCLEEQFQGEDGFAWNRPQGGIFILGQFSHEIDGEGVAKIAREKYGLLLEKDKYMYSNGKSRNTTRINFVQNPDDMFREGIARLHKACKEAKR